MTLLFHTAAASFRPALSLILFLSLYLSLSLSFSGPTPPPHPPQKLKQLSRGYLEVVKTLFDRHSAPPEGKPVERGFHGPEL